MNDNSDLIKKKHVLVLLIKEILSQLDDVCLLKKKDRCANISMQLMGEMCSVLQEFDLEMQEIYFEVLIALGGSPNASITPRGISEDYLKSSLAVKQRFLEQIKNELRSLAV